MSLLERWDYQRELSAQFPAPAVRHLYRSSEERIEALAEFVDFYNHRRPHGGLDGGGWSRPPRFPGFPGRRELRFRENGGGGLLTFFWPVALMFTYPAALTGALGGAGIARARPRVPSRPDV